MRRHVSHSPECSAKSRLTALVPAVESPRSPLVSRNSLHPSSPASDTSRSERACHLDYEGDTGGFDDGTNFPFEGEMDVDGELNVDDEMEPDDGVAMEPLDVNEMNTQRVLRRIEEEELVVEEFPTSSNGMSPK